MTESLLGASVGNYRVTSFLGEGGMGQVYLAEHPTIHRRVAIKVLSAQYSHQPQAAERFVAEARAVTRIEHENVIDIYDFGSLPDGRIYYVMEVLKGRELRKVMGEKGKFTSAEVWPYLQQIAAGLQAAHDHGVVHRDLKPENIFVLDRKPLTVKILDFGIAKILETKQGAGRTSTGIVMGTPLFIAPEQAAGQPERITPRTDLYSLGVILYWMLCERPPFVAETIAILLAEHIQKAPPALLELEPSVPPTVAALVHQCLEKDPAARPRSAQALASAWREALGTSPEVVIDLVQRRDSTARSLVAEPIPEAASAPTVPLASEPRPAARTTLGASASELVADEEVLVVSSRGKWIATAAVGALVLGAVALVAIRSGSDVPHSVPAAAQPVREVKRAADVLAVAPLPPARPAVHTVEVRLADARATCRFQVGSNAVSTRHPPCRVEVAARQSVVLRVELPGFKPYRETWVVSGDRHIDLVAARSTKRIVVEGTEQAGRSASATKKAPVAGKPSRDAGSPAVAPLATPTLRAPDAAVPAPKPAAAVRSPDAAATKTKSGWIMKVRVR